MDPGAGLEEIVPGNDWMPVNLLDLFQSILDDVPREREYQPTGEAFPFQHQKYALVPCGTSPIHGGNAMRWDGEWMNLAPLFVSHWPRVIEWPAPIWDEGLGAYRGADVSDKDCEHRLHGIRYQN